jgi:hypothetical protein
VFVANGRGGVGSAGAGAGLEIDEDEDKDKEEDELEAVEEVVLMLGRLMMSRGFLFVVVACSCAVSDERVGRCTVGRFAGLWLIVTFSISIAFLFVRLRLRLSVFLFRGSKLG